MQDEMFPTPPAPAKPVAKSKAKSSSVVVPVPASTEHLALRTALPANVRMGCSSWSYPGWQGLVWQGEHSEHILAKRGLHAYAQHPLLRAVCLDRVFYKPLIAAEYAAYAAQVGDDFRFIVKAPSLITDPLVRNENGKGMQINPAFLDADLALRTFVEPATQGLGKHLGALVFQISPLPDAWFANMPQLLQRLATMLHALPAINTLRTLSPDVVIAVEVRDRQWLTPAFAAVLKEAGVTYCLGLHAKMPAIDAQLPILRTLWPGPLVARWNLNPLHGAYGYEAAQRDYSPYNRIVDPDPHTRGVLTKVINATVDAGFAAYVTVSNKAEGSAPLSVVGLAEAVAALRG